MFFSIDGKTGFEIELNNNPVANTWYSLIKESYVGDGLDFDNRRTFYSFKTINEMQLDLLNAIEKINLFLKKEFIKIKKPINWNDQNFYNYLHICFEKLSGSYDNHTRLLHVAPIKIKESIRDLNFCVHSLESKQYNKINLKKSEIRIEFSKNRNTKRVPLKKVEEKLFQFSLKKFEVYLSYNELGKTYLDLHKDNLPIDYVGIKNNHFIGKDIFISLLNKKNIFDKNFIKWMEKNNKNPYDKTIGLGVLPIGRAKINKDVLNQLTKNSKLTIIKDTI
jgi:hypothetical protein